VCFAKSGILFGIKRLEAQVLDSVQEGWPDIRPVPILSHRWILEMDITRSLTGARAKDDTVAVLTTCFYDRSSCDGI